MPPVHSQAQLRARKLNTFPGSPIVRMWEEGKNQAAGHDSDKV